MTVIKQKMYSGLQ